VGPESVVLLDPTTDGEFCFLDACETLKPDALFLERANDPFGVEELLGDFPDLDVLEEIKAFRWYYNDAPLSAVKRPRLSIRRWIANARRRD